MRTIHFVSQVLLSAISCRQTVITVLNPVMSPTLRIARFASLLGQSYDQRFCWSESVSQGAFPCLPLTTVLGHVEVPRLAPLPQFFASVVEKLARDGRNATSHKPIKRDRPLIVQFAAHSAEQFASAAEIVAPFADGVDLNCGCPQRWAMAEGYGACLLSNPEKLADMVHQARQRISDPAFTISIKIRIHPDIRRSVDLCRRAERCGVSWITVHGRTKDQRCQPVDFNAIRIIKDGVSIPVVANGDVFCSADVDNVVEMTGADGVMSARGLLANPTMYAGFSETPADCVQNWLNISLSVGTPFPSFHHHLIHMLEKQLSQAERRVFNSFSSVSAVLDFVKETILLG